MCDNASHFHIARTSEILGWIGSTCGWPGCSWAATVQFCNEFPGSKYTLHLKVPKIAEFHALKLSTVKLSTAIWLHKWLINDKRSLDKEISFLCDSSLCPMFWTVKELQFNLRLSLVSVSWMLTLLVFWSHKLVYVYNWQFSGNFLWLNWPFFFQCILQTQFFNCK